MREKKQFFIPKNYEKKFEWIPGISGWNHIAFVPIAALDYLVIQYTPFEFSNKVTFIGISLALPWILMATHPVRENVPLWKHLYWRIKFMARQRQFKYKKEGYVNEIQSIETKGSKPTETSKKERSRFDSIEGNKKRVIDHTGQQDGSMPKSVGR